MRRTTTIPSDAQQPGTMLTIRKAVPADTLALRRLAQLDSALAPGPVPTLVAEVGGELRAALPLDGGPAIANPFQRTAELVAMLSARAQQVDAPARDPARGPRRSASVPRPTPAHRA